MGAARFGFEMGTCARTYVTASAPYALACAILLLGPASGEALIAGMGFGLGRALPLGLRLMTPNKTSWDRCLTGYESRLAVVCLLALAATVFAGGV